MRVTGIHLQNFGSYEELTFDFTNQGLTLIQGPTGAGKSTILDAISWILYGKTAKGGSVDEVLSWPGDKVTVGCLSMEPNLSVMRRRGRKAKDNDLVFCTEYGQDIRGKDLSDTQRLLNKQLGVDHEAYLSGAYFHEFSQTAQFFTTTARNRREICEQIVDLTLAVRLQVRTKELNDNNDEELDKTQQERKELKQKISLLTNLQQTENTKAERWETQHKSTVQYVTQQAKKFEDSRERIIKNECPSCGTVLAKPKKVLDKSENPHLLRLEELKSEINPHSGTVKDYSTDIEVAEICLGVLDSKFKHHGVKQADFDILQEVLQTFRSTLIQNSINQLQDTTNRFLADYFDAEIQVEFESQENDKLEALIQKDGHSCSFTQLSKGQRQLLKLCFAVSVMQAVSDHKGVKFAQIFFDEALSGLDDTMKTKAFKMLESLQQSYESIFVIDHSEGLKTLFSNRYNVSLVNGKSEIQKV